MIQSKIYYFKNSTLLHMLNTIVSYTLAGKDETCQRYQMNFKRLRIGKSWRVPEPKNKK